MHAILQVVFIALREAHPALALRHPPWLGATTVAVRPPLPVFLSASPSRRWRSARVSDQLWYVFYKLGKECGSQRAPTPANTSNHIFKWPILINPYTQSLDRPDGALDLAWSRKMIQMALNCMQELIRITCRRNTGWDKTVADIPLPAQEALAAFPDLAEQYAQLKRDAREARGGGIPYGY